MKRDWQNFFKLKDFTTACADISNYDTRYTLDLRSLVCDQANAILREAISEAPIHEWEEPQRLMGQTVWKGKNTHVGRLIDIKSLDDKTS